MHSCIHNRKKIKWATKRQLAPWHYMLHCFFKSSIVDNGQAVDGISWYLGLSSKVQNPRRLSSLEWTYNFGWVTNYNLASPTNGWKASNCLCNMITKHITYLVVYIYIHCNRTIGEFLSFWGWASICHMKGQKSLKRSPSNKSTKKCQISQQME